MSHLKGLLVVLIVSGIMWAGWTAYYDFLNQGQQPTESTQILNAIEKKGVPEVTVNDYRGHSVSLAELKGKVVILNFWASWCDPCVEEFPSLIKLVEHFKGKVILLAISSDYTLADMEVFLKAYGMKDPNIHVMWDKDQKVGKQFGTFVLPESYILNKEGILIKKVVGVDDWYNEHAIRYFDNLLAEKANPHK